MNPLHLVVPGLLRPWPQAGVLPPLPALETLLARSERRPGADSAEEALFDLFDLPREARGPAAWRWLGRYGTPPEGTVVQVHPVHFRADRDRLLLFTLPPLPAEEAAALAESFNAHFSELDLRLEPRGGWLVGAPVAHTRFVPLAEVAGRPLEGAFPAGEQARFWARLLNETQMLYFQHPLNREREARGEPAVNGLWFDGPGAWRPVNPVGPRIERSGDDPLPAALAAWACSDPQRGRLWWLDELETAWRAQCLPDWQQALGRFDALLAEAMERERQLFLHAGGGRTFCWDRRARLRFWRRRRVLSDWW